jgi:hypothetical protein
LETSGVIRVGNTIANQVETIELPTGTYRIRVYTSGTPPNSVSFHLSRVS